MSQSILFYNGKLKHIEALQSHMFTEGIDPVFASTGREVIKQIEKNPPSMILLSCHEYSLNAQEIDTLLEVQHSAADIPIVFVANGSSSVIEKAMDFADIIHEDDDVTEFMQTVKNLIQKHVNSTNHERAVDILVAEDDIIIRKTVERLLAKNGYLNVRFARDGEEAWELIQAKQPELIILDYMMPRASGFEVLQRIRIDYNFDHIPVIFLTAISDKERLIEALDAGATDYITKPFDQAELLARVHTHARNYYLQKQLLKVNENLGLINKELSSKNIQIEGDLRSARKIQEALLPKETIDSDMLDIHFLYKPSHAVGGDFLNFVQLDPSHIAFYIADVSGHGVTSAMITVFVREQIANIVKKTKTSKRTAASILGQLNRNYNEEIYFLDNGVYLTIFFGILNLETRHLNYASAGHHAFPIICSADGKTSEICDTEIAIGFLEEYTFTDNYLTLHSKDRLLLHTDGIMEIRNSADEFFGIDRIKQFLSEHKSDDANELLEQLVKTSCTFCNLDEQSDDIALMLLDFI